MTNEPLEELQFTEEEIDHGVKAMLRTMVSLNGAPVALVEASDTVRAVLRAVRAVPARCLNGGLAGHPAAPGTAVQGAGLGGVQVCGWVVWSYPVTTCLRTVNHDEVFVWTNTLRSWDPSTEQAVIGPPSTGKMVTTPRTLAGSALGLANGKVWLSGEADAYLRADDDGMPCERGR